MDSTGLAYTPRNYARRPLTRAELLDLVGPRAPREAVNPRSPAVRALGVDAATLADDQALALMLENQNLIRRPVLAVGERRIAGFTPDAYADLG